jgi:hypothetical protein
MCELRSPGPASSGERRDESTRMNRKHADLVGPALLLVALIVAFFAYFVRPGLIDQGRGSLATSSDFHGYFLPRFIHGSRALLSGEVPLWNRFESGGMPFLATMQPATFYPPKVLFYGLLPPEPAHWAFLVFHYLLAAGAFFAFLAGSGSSGVGAFVGAAVWVFSTPILASNYHPIRIASLVWMPVVFLLSKRAASGDRKALAALALAVTFQIFAGYPEFSLDLGLMVPPSRSARSARQCSCFHSPRSPARRSERIWPARTSPSASSSPTAGARCCSPRPGCADSPPSV